MQISGETNNLDLYSEARDWCGIESSDTTTLTLAVFVRSANFGLDRLNGLAMRADGKWQFDDANQTTELLDVTTNLVSGTQAYAIAITWLKIGRVRIKNSNGERVTLPPVDRRQLSDSMLRRDAGDPKVYDKLGNLLYLHPKPNYASTNGLEIQYQRASSYFIITDTTKVPGFATQYHELIALYGALNYCEKNDLDKRAAKIRLRIGNPPNPLENIPGSGLEGEFVEFYSTRDPEQKMTLNPQGEDYGQIGLIGDASYGSGRHPDKF